MEWKVFVLSCDIILLNSLKVSLYGPTQICWLNFCRPLLKPIKFMVKKLFLFWCTFVLLLHWGFIITFPCMVYSVGLLQLVRIWEPTRSLCYLERLHWGVTCCSVLVMWLVNMVWHKSHTILVVLGLMFTQIAGRLVVNIHCIIFVGLISITSEICCPRLVNVVSTICTLLVVNG